tara:strand:+ start:29202 stop:30041 length:840 start_codon:yes stop_codon:yes gene_type:complete
MTICKKLIIGNSRLSKNIINERNFSNYELISLRDIISGVKTNNNSYKTIFYISQITRRYFNNPELLRINKLITEYVLNLTSDSTQIIFISSIDVFGNKEKKLNSSLKRDSFDFYSQSKIETEIKLEENIPKTMFLRLPGMYGSDLEEESIISRMIKTLLNCNAIKLTSPKIIRSTISYSYTAKYILECFKEFCMKSDSNYYGIVGAKQSLTLKEIASFLLEKKNIFGNNNNLIIQHDNDSKEGRIDEQHITQSDLDIINYEPESIYFGINSFIQKLFSK